MADAEEGREESSKTDEKKKEQEDPEANDDGSRKDFEYPTTVDMEIGPVVYETVPCDDPLVWGLYEGKDEIDALIANLNVRGLREKALREALDLDRSKATSGVGRPKPARLSKRRVKGASDYFIEECR